MATFLPSIHVHALPGDRRNGILQAGGLALPCRLGRSGPVARKREGDGGTPIGDWRLRRVFYRPDRMARPVSGLPVSPIAPDQGWSENPDDPAYNRLVTLPHRFSHEYMWRDDHLYDIVVVVGHNDDPVLKGAGSAIFMHLLRPEGTPTAGCVGLRPQDLRRLLPRLGPDTRLVVQG
ncbi:L,D-transpeptidase family protein [Lutibaculum baratangense]|uniref:L,D-TPase catalytic domain-containing protein n=1 Tax=Lutibaculum baratangense AMV1 TaxID=631454 RepID=V4RJ39_9HYPH|nr:L,D-transpeptidase family protein [Lutibaculum baratangense]ESR26101.1 hypothetical protein N177_1436 [Lutibaculum baratangense AMV1]